MTVSRIAAVLAVLAVPAAATSPYQGQERRAIASLSEEDVSALLAGEGWGFAKAAELNGWPGPAHVLALADDLGLDAQQRAEVEAIRDAMRETARRLGADFVAAEAALDAAFTEGEIDEDRLAGLTADAARLRGELRAAHLAAHLRTTPILTPHQRHEYDRLRGYADAAGGHGGHAHD